MTLAGITPYQIDLGVTLLGNISETPDLETSLLDGEGRNLFLSTVNATWQGTGRDRTVRVSTFDRPLRASQGYKVSIRTRLDGNWSTPVVSEDTVTLSK